MNENWGCQDILFSVDPKIQRQTTDAKVSYPVPIIEKPFVRCAFGSTVTSCTSVFNKLQHKAMSELIDYDKTLFSLGAVLIELWLGRTFEVLKTRDDTAWVESRKLINTMYDSDAGNNYVSAVEQCFGQRRAAWDVKPIPRNLKNEDFKKEVCSTVISVLEENLQVSSGWDRSSIFNSYRETYSDSQKTEV